MEDYQEKKQHNTDQDDGVRGHGTHLPLWAYQKYIYIEKFSLKTKWRLAERLLYNQGCKKDPHGIIREEGKKSSQVQPVLLGGDSEEKGDDMAEILPGEWVVRATYWVPQPWGPTKGRQDPLAGWSGGGTNRRAVGCLGTFHEECTNTFLLLRQGRECELRTHSWLTGFPQPPQCAPQPELSEHSSPACPCHSFMVKQELPWQMKAFSSETRRGSDLKQYLSREGAAIAGADMDGASEPVQISDHGQTATACAPDFAKCLHWPLLLPCCSPLEQGCQCWEGGRAHTRRELSWLRPKLQGFCTSNLGPDPTPQ